MCPDGKNHLSEKDILKEELLKECDFGILRGKLYGAVDEPLYQQWIDSGGSNTFPGGENPYDFRKRSVEGFINVWILYTG